jgi:hypothetical protein
LVRIGIGTHTRNRHIPSHLVVNQWASDVESSSHLDFLCLHDS